jgi:hypothetical protein
MINALQQMIQIMISHLPTFKLPWSNVNYPDEGTQTASACKQKLQQGSQDVEGTES